MADLIAGTTLHSGLTSQVRLHRERGPVRFRRGRREIRAEVDAVVATPRCTVLGGDGIRVALVEHLLAALHLRGVWSEVVIEVSADELPILDGSAEPWLAAVDALGDPPAAAPALRPARPVEVRDGLSWARLEPGPVELDVGIAFDHPAIGEQRWRGGPGRWDELAAARTFGFLDEVEALRARGLAAGGSLENAIVFDGAGPVRPLRFPDEPVRHKALDALGDLYLLGRPLGGRCTVRRGSHRLHLELMRRLRPLSPDADVGESDVRGSDVPDIDRSPPEPGTAS